MTVDTEKDTERGGAAPATRFVSYLNEYDVQLRDGVTFEQFATEAEALAHELARATVASKAIFKTAEIERQFRLIVENASSVRALLDKSPLVREEMQYLTGRQLLKRWICREFADAERPTEEQRLAAQRELERIEATLSDHPIEEVMASILEAARFGEQGAAGYGPETPEHRRATIRDETIGMRCADVFEDLTVHAASRFFLHVGEKKQEQVGRFPAFVDVVCDRISEILDEQGFECLRRHPSDRTLKRVIKNRSR